MRTIVDIPKDSIDALGSICEKKHISRAEAIRRAVSEFIEQQRCLSNVADENKAFGIWSHKQVNALEYEDNIRSEWDNPK